MYVSSDVVVLGASHLQTDVCSASSIGTYYMPVAVGDHADICLYDSGVTLSQASPAAIEHMLPYLMEVDAGDVDFISVGSRPKASMRLFSSRPTSLIQIESKVRSHPAETLIIENPMLKSFPLLLGLQTMSDLDFSMTHRTVIVRDEEGRPAISLVYKGSKTEVITVTGYPQSILTDRGQKTNQRYAE